MVPRNSQRNTQKEKLDNPLKDNLPVFIYEWNFWLIHVNYKMVSCIAQSFFVLFFHISFHVFDQAMSIYKQNAKTCKTFTHIFYDLHKHILANIGPSWSILKAKVEEIVNRYVKVNLCSIFVHVHFIAVRVSSFWVWAGTQFI